MTGFRRRLWIARWRGMSPQGAQIGVAVMLGLMLALSIWVQERLNDERAVGAGRKLVVLAGAVESHVRANYGQYVPPALPAGASIQIDIDLLKADDFLPLGFDQSGDAMKRPLQAWAISTGGGRVRLLSMQVLSAGDTRHPVEGTYEARGEQALGIVNAAGELQGPTIQENLAAFRAVAGGHPRQWAMAVYRQLDRESVCGDAVLRRERTGCPDSARMETDLDMNGNDVVGVKVLTAEELQVDRVMRAGEFRIDQTLQVGTTGSPGSLEVLGGVRVPDGLVFRGDAEFTGTVNANAVEVAGRLDADSADVAQGVTAQTIQAQGNLGASGANFTGSVSVTGTGSFGSLSVGSCSGCQ